MVTKPILPPVKADDFIIVQSAGFGTSKLAVRRKAIDAFQDDGNGNWALYVGGQKLAVAIDTTVEGLAALASS